MGHRRLIREVEVEVDIDATDSGIGPVPIEWIAKPGDDPVAIFADPDASGIWLEDVTSADGAATMVYGVARTLPNDCSADDLECQRGFFVHHLMMRNLATGHDTNLGVVGTV